MTLYLSQKKLLILLLLSLAIGFLLGFLYDVIRTFRKARKPRRRVFCVLHVMLVALEDFLFFTFGGTVFSILFFVVNSGKVRPSAFLMALLGFLFYRTTLSAYTLCLFTYMIGCVKGVLVWFWSMLFLPPLRLFIGWLWHIGRRISLAFRRRAAKRFFKRLSKMGKEGYAHGISRL